VGGGGTSSAGTGTTTASTASTSASSTGGPTCDHKMGVIDCSTCDSCANGQGGPCEPVRAACTNDNNTGGCVELLVCVEGGCNPGPPGCVGACEMQYSSSVQDEFNKYQSCICAQCAMHCSGKAGCP
jgi:hypothetical protein